ncbi:hypothetical protein EAL2_808p01340 (plasmid) [Peptoclostridium acidaminophilum DSM 3953]|uniref:SMODS-associated and fused to various effectors domain-containing protein n=1 Tax=Peptoclostridium acidaminophilum DSM 3953 TaxID=1286171 RepID=W8T7G2_PEPAC|nr:HNH endonuclease [Peptoclostridium acidaminophilum]AHM57639.1 hypothetical protein EAL2_808p01340 [Peptoclostridium acidaminophilum DSM 3953]
MASVRNIKAEVERLLWGIAAGRCEFEGCNKVLYQHEVTGDTENYAQKAHIYAVSPGGARFCPDSEDFKNSVKNLMLVCPQCHITIDRNEQKYTPELLFEMKRRHEERIFKLTSIGAELHSHMVYYTANIAGTNMAVNDGDARNALALFGRYPSDISPIELGQRGNFVEDNEEDFFISNSKNLYRAVKARILDVVSEGESIALFPLAPQPLLMYLGRLLNDKYNVAVFQCHRREQDKWRWNDTDEQVRFRSILPDDASASSKIALVFSLSSTISFNRIKSVLGNDVLIYSVTIDLPNRTFVTNSAVMDEFVTKSREVMEVIKQRHGKDTDIHVFPAMPASLAVRFGMDYMSKTDSKLVIYDEQPEKGFVYALTVGGNNER